MIKLVMPMKRRPGMTIPEFREYYETKHRLIGEKYLKGYASRYMRRFTNPTVDRDGELRLAPEPLAVQVAQHRVEDRPGDRSAPGSVSAVTRRAG